ncbi:MAG TPA: gephyrin-like molybdotransferase Glp [Acidimicrobiales bacterium]|nr:gephyrin-like molybdotransferase Glp [Acidimicrobiales bacterium]
MLRRLKERAIGVVTNPTQCVALIVIVASTAFVFWQLRPALLFANTTPSGGDMGAHVWAPAYLRDHLLPHGRLTGWTPDWYEGFPALTFYFPLPSLLIVILDVVLPYGIAFKLVTVLGLLALPAAAYVFARLIGLRGPSPACLSVLTVPFLFDRSYTIYGGNIPSTLAGEFSFSISLAVALLFLGVFARGLRTGRQRGLAAVLLAITGLCHFIPTFFAIGGAALLFLLQPTRQRLRYAAPVAIVGGMIGAFWWLPFYMRLPYTTDMGWEPLRTYRESLITHSLEIPLILAALGLATSVVLKRRGGIYLGLLAGGAAVAFVVAPPGRLWNARLLPFWFLAVYMLAGVGVAVMGEAVAAVAGYLSRPREDVGNDSPALGDGRAPVDAVRTHVLSRCEPLVPVPLALRDALGTVAADAIEAEEAAPPFANSAMDGFAVRAADVAAVPVALTVVATVAAGDDAANVHVGPGEAARIMTGAPVPAGADAVVMIEDTDGGPNGRVEIRRAVAAGHFIRQVGDDVAPGDEVVGAGEVLSPARLGLLAAVGCRRVSAIPIPRVGVLATGDELVSHGDVLRHGQIRDSNRVLLLGLVAAAGCEPVDLGVVGDDRMSIGNAVRAATASCDAVLTTGGVSVGDFDFLAPVLADLGDSWTFRLPIKPAKPFVFGVVEGVPVFGLPGNPVSAAVSFELIARPALRQMAGYPSDQLDRPAVVAVADQDLARRPDGKTHYARVAAFWDGVDGRVRVRSAGAQGSHVLSGLAAANGLAVLPDGGGVRAGDDVRVLLLDVPTEHPPVDAANGHGVPPVAALPPVSVIEPDSDTMNVSRTPTERWVRALTPIVVTCMFLGITALPLGALPKSFAITTTDSSFIPGWVKWNYNGYERKAAYPEYRDVVATMGRVGKTNGCGRASWEYEPELDRYGTPMALMLLPYWTKGCIGSMEGLYFESSATTPYHFLSNSELSLRPPRPQRDLPYRDLDVKLGVQHLQLMGVRYYMALSDAAQSQANVNPDLKLIATSKPFSAVVTESGKPAETKTRSWKVYEVANSAVVAPLAFEPAVMTGVPKGGRGWQDAAVDWFQGDPSHWEVQLAASGPKEWARVKGAIADPPRRAVTPATVSHVRTGDDYISFDVDRPGSPVLVKASYFPNWKAKGARGPWRVTPNQMVVIPTSRHVRLHYGETPVDLMGWALTILGILAVVGFSRRDRLVRRDDEAAADAVVLPPPASLASELQPEAPQPVH